MLIVLLLVVYVLAGRLGLHFAFVNASATALWPPTGIAIASVLVFGPRVWPAIFVGAFVVNVLTAGSIATSLGIAIGNALEALLAGRLVMRLAGGLRAFQRPQDVFKFLALAGVMATAVSATIGVTSLTLGGYAPWADYGRIWLTWWLGDASGAIIVTPVLLLLDREVARVARGRPIEPVALAAAVVIGGELIFGGVVNATARL